MWHCEGPWRIIWVFLLASLCLDSKLFICYIPTPPLCYMLWEGVRSSSVVLMGSFIWRQILSHFLHLFFSCSCCFDPPAPNLLHTTATNQTAIQLQPSCEKNWVEGTKWYFYSEVLGISLWYHLASACRDTSYAKPYRTYMHRQYFLHHTLLSREWETLVMRIPLANGHRQPNAISPIYWMLTIFSLWPHKKSEHCTN